jgi:hypothetical protein
MKFKGTIVITDPCYIIPDDNKEDWDKCAYGENMEALGIYNYFVQSTIYGDWGCATYNCGDNNPTLMVDILANIVNFLYEKYNGYSEDEENKWNELTKAFGIDKFEIIGKFAADSGQVGVFLLSEILEYNPDFNKFIEEVPWCVTVIENFNGDVNYHIDDDNHAHIVGTGKDYNFYTRQTNG